jgi:GNAT superfamily N-acetyltransferase
MYWQTGPDNGGREPPQGLDRTAWQSAAQCRLATQEHPTMPSITVRQAVFADLDVLADLFNQYREFQGCASQPAAARAFLRAHFDHGEAVVFLAHEGTQAVGFAQLYPSYSSTALARVFVLNDLFVCPSGRRKGVASGLLMAMEAYAWAQGAARVTLNVARDNLPGQALY